MRIEGQALFGQGLGFAYKPGQWLFQDLYIAINSGEIVGLIGPSGCGKTTLARILAGYEKPHVGSVSLGTISYPLRGIHPVQMVFQHPEHAVNPYWSMARVLQESGEPDERVIDSLRIERSWLKRRSVELSGGELQRICIARALVPTTRFLIADEMTAMLDALTQAQVWHAVLEIAREYKLGVLVISHDRHLLHKLCDRIIKWVEL